MARKIANLVPSKLDTKIHTNEVKKGVCLSTLASVSSDCSLFAQSFVQVGLDSIQEVRCVDIMFIQLAAARSQCRGYICNKL